MMLSIELVFLNLWKLMRLENCMNFYVPNVIRLMRLMIIVVVRKKIVLSRLLIYQILSSRWIMSCIVRLYSGWFISKKEI